MAKQRNKKGQFTKGTTEGYRFTEGNKDAEKWTVDTVLPILNKIYAALTDGKDDVNGNVVRANDIKLAGEVRLMYGVTKQQWSEWKEKFSEIPEVSDLMEIVSEILECRLIYSGTRMDEVVLKNHYNYTDRLAQEIGGRDGKPIETKTTIDYSKLPAHVKDAILAAAGVDGAINPDA